MKKTFASVLSLTLTLALSACSANSAAENRFANYDYSVYDGNVQYNENPDLSNKYDKPIGDNVSVVEFTFEQHVDCSDAVIVGTPIGDGEQVIYDMTNCVYIKDRTESSSFDEMEVTLTTIQVDSIVYGNITLQTIILMQNGLPEDDSVQYKLKMGEEYVIMLEEFVDGTYKLPTDVEGLFFIDDDFLLTSLSGKAIFSRYDGLPLSDFAGDVVAAKSNADNTDF